MGRFHLKVVGGPPQSSPGAPTSPQYLLAREGRLLGYILLPDGVKHSAFFTEAFKALLFFVPVHLVQREFNTSLQNPLLVSGDHRGL